MPDPAVPVAAPDVVERLQRQLTIPLSIMGGESYVLDTDDVREATAEITRLREELAAVTLHLRTAEEAADHSPFSSLSLACTITALRARVAELERDKDLLRSTVDVCVLESAILRSGLQDIWKANQDERAKAALLRALEVVKSVIHAPDPRDARIAELTTKLALSEDACLGQNRRAVAAEARLAVLEAALRVVHQAIADYHYALDTRQNGDVACYHAVRAIEVGLELPWKQGAEAERRALGEGHG